MAIAPIGSAPSVPALASAKSMTSAPSRRTSSASAASTTLASIRVMTPPHRTDFAFRSSGLGLGYRRDRGVMRRLPAGGIGRRGVAGERQRLTAAAAPVDLAPVARAAGLLHPVRAAKGVEGGARAPDVAKRSVADVPEFEAWNRLGRMAGPCRSAKH